MAKMSEERLARYRSLDRPAFDFANEAVSAFFLRVAETGYNLDTTGFLAHPGFFQAPYSADGAGIDIALLGNPLDLGAIGLAGARHGPQAVREASRNYGPVNEITGHIPFDQCAVGDVGDVQWSSTSLAQRLEDIAQRVHELASGGSATLNCGGEHTTAYGALKGLSAAHDGEAFGLLHIDAHCDTMATWGGDAVNDGSVFRQAVLQGFVDPERAVQVGIRGRSGFLWEFSHDSGMTVITADEVHEKGTQWVIDRAREVIGTDKAYISFDVDGLDSGSMMATTGPEPFGLSPRQARAILHGTRDLHWVGADLVELNPNRDPNGYGAHIAAAFFFELLCVLADSRVARQRCGVTEWKR